MVRFSSKLERSYASIASSEPALDGSFSPSSPPTSPHSTVSLSEVPECSNSGVLPSLGRDVLSLLTLVEVGQIKKACGIVELVPRPGDSTAGVQQVGG